MKVRIILFLKRDRDRGGLDDFRRVERCGAAVTGGQLAGWVWGIDVDELDREASRLIAGQAVVGWPPPTWTATKRLGYRF